MVKNAHRTFHAKRIATFRLRTGRVLHASGTNILFGRAINNFFQTHRYNVVFVNLFCTDRFTGEKHNRKTRYKSRSEGIQNQHYIPRHVLQQRSVTNQRDRQTGVQTMQFSWRGYKVLPETMGNLTEVVQGLQRGNLYVSPATFLFFVPFCFEKHNYLHSLQYGFSSATVSTRQTNALVSITFKWLLLKIIATRRGSVCLAYVS